MSGTRNIIALTGLLMCCVVQASIADAIPPYGWIRHCGLTQHPACAIGRPLTGEDLAWLHAGVVGQIKPVEDPDDHWELFPARGDCEDYAISMRAALIAFGVKPEDTSIVIGHAVLPDSEGTHAVLEVISGDAVWILDSAADHIYTPSARPYPFKEQARQLPGEIKWSASE